MRIPLYQVDAFTNEPLRGNPAAVCPLTAWLPDDRLQALAAENNLSETAFFVPEADGWRLRWFTPQVEVNLCGHATLATAWVLFHRLSAESPLQFHSRSGRLTVHRHGDRIVLDFPALPPQRAAAPDGLAEALGKAPAEVWRAPDLLAVYPAEADVRGLSPDFGALGRLQGVRGIIVTAPGRDCDFVSRFFGPAVGINEDPVTGSAHCVLTPYWAERLQRNALHARQISARGGELWCTRHGDRVHIAGYAAPYLEGTVTLPG